jgi:hypothetical protein
VAGDLVSQSFPPILVYTMGKVGSSTVFATLSSIGLPNPVYHAHFLSHEGIRRAERFFLSLETPRIPEHIVRSRALRKRLDRRRPRRWKVISLVREPVSWTVSNFFQNVGSYYPNLLDAQGRVKLDESVAFLQEQLAAFDEATDYVCTWFDRELKQVFDIDVYKKPFDHEQGFEIFHGETADLLILRMNDLDSVLGGAIRKFLPTDRQFNLVRSNVGASKADSGAYRYVMSTLAVPEPAVSHIYSSRYAKHFWTEVERKEMTRTWSAAR